MEERHTKKQFFLKKEKDNKRLQKDRDFPPGAVYPEDSQSRSAGGGSSINELTTGSTPKKTQSHRAKYDGKIFSVTAQRL